ncbi:MAG: PrsW family intramembrane metalloprotease [Ktedonobacterales bacterium]|nr:PrsW family intramembrane metalloprotease [Ktedonobacterales bacterium]
MESSICPHCGSSLSPGNARCAICGAPGTLASPREGAPWEQPAPTTRATPPSGPSAAPEDQWPGRGGYSTAPFPPNAPATPPAGNWPTPGGPAAQPPTPWPLVSYPPQGGPPQASGSPPPYPYGAPPGYAPPGYAPPGYAPPGYAPPGYAPPPYYYYPSPAPPARRPPGDTYALVIAWIAIVGGALSIIGGLLIFLVALLGIALGTGDGLALLAPFTGFILAPLIGGILALSYGIGRVRHLPARKLSLPPATLFAALTLAVLAGAVVLWNTYPLPGPSLAVLPLVVLSGVLPALAIVFLGARRLGMPSTGRRFWLSLFFGATVAPVLAAILEVLLGLLLLLVARALGYTVNGSITDITSAPNNAAEAVVLLLTLSVVAPVVEEGLKPLGAVLIMRRLRSPSEAFLLGLAAGVGFDIVETIGYIGMGEADWITVAIQRVGAGLLHGVGAAMAALGWYYLINGKGVPHRWLRGFGGLAYAVIQHAVFNGSNLLTIIPGVGDLLSKPWYLGALPIDNGTFLFFVYYVLILGVLFYVTGRLARGQTTTSSVSATPARGPTGPLPQASAGGAR